MADVFVSYARIDKARVAPLVAAIEANGWTVWWDPAISPGQEFDRQIAAELKIAGAVLVVWTPNSVESRWVRGEAREGAARGILVPVRFDDADLPIDVRALHTTDFDDWGEDAGSPQAREVLRALDAMIARRPTPPPATTIASSVTTRSTPGPARVAICVLPFANMSGDPEQEYFSDGITEDVITDLSKVSALAVISRNSAFVYKGRHVDVPRVARELKVSHVLEGSVRKAGGRVRITAQLVDATSNDHVWAERYDRDLSDIFALQDEISQAIVAALKLRLLPGEKQAIERRGTDNVEAYNLYLMAWQHYVTGHRSEEDIRSTETIIRLCIRATEIDPKYAHAWALLAIGQMILYFAHGRAGDDGLAAVEKALVLNPGLAEAHAIKARILSRSGRHDEAATEIETCPAPGPGLLRGQSIGCVLEFQAAATRGCHPLLGKGGGADGRRCAFAFHVDHVLHGRRRPSGGQARCRGHTCASPETPGAGPQQLVSPHSWRQRACCTWGGRARQGVDEPRATAPTGPDGGAL